MKNILIMLLGLLISTIAFADNPLVAANITIENHSKQPIVLAGWSLGCGMPQGVRSLTIDHSAVEQCTYQDELYYDFSPPAATILPGESTSATVINDKNTNAFGRLGIQYARQQIEKIECGLIIDFNNDAIETIKLNPTFSRQLMTCALTVNDHNILVSIG